MIQYNSINTFKEIHYNGEEIKYVYDYQGKVWEKPPVGTKFSAVYYDLTTYSAVCDGDSTLTSATTKPSGYEYREMTFAEIGSCVTTIDVRAFRDFYLLESITIPNSVTTIGDYAFNNCTSLTSITIPDSVTSIGMGAFQSCTSLTSIDIPSGVTSINTNAFQNCSGLTSVTIGNGVTSIGRSAFIRCSGMTSCTIGSSVTSIGNQAFSWCYALTSITIPDSVTSIGNWAFDYCSGLTNITVEATTPPTLGYSAFTGSYCPIYVPCESLETYKTASGWSTYADRIQCVFDGKYKLTLNDYSTVTAECDSSDTIRKSEISAYTSTVVSAEIGDCVTSIGMGAFQSCTSLTSVTIPSSVTSIGQWAFHYCSGLTSVTIPNSVTSIGDSAFSNCKSLTSINIPSGVTIIEGGVFQMCSGLTSIEIPSGVTSIGNYAFDYCTSLTSITVNAVTPPTLGSSYVFNESYCPIYVPSASVNAYKTATNWSTYADRIQAIPNS